MVILACVRRVRAHTTVCVCPRRAAVVGAAKRATLLVLTATEGRVIFGHAGEGALVILASLVGAAHTAADVVARRTAVVHVGDFAAALAQPRAERGV